ncbi:hypothetical protein T484DRAFT_2271903 [Baffinella frigidus]|nr:hypothetical protein T484DRAFT_2271903 [Cryptophyta sp. CCMP2293]
MCQGHARPHASCHHLACAIRGCGSCSLTGYSRNFFTGYSRKSLAGQMASSVAQPVGNDGPIAIASAVAVPMAVSVRAPPIYPPRVLSTSRRNAHLCAISWSNARLPSPRPCHVRGNGHLHAITCGNSSRVSCVVEWFSHLSATHRYEIMSKGSNSGHFWPCYPNLKLPNVPRWAHPRLPPATRSGSHRILRRNTRVLFIPRTLR